MAHPIEVLLVEDNPADADLVRESLEESKLFLQITILPDGEQGLSYLLQEGAFADAKRPDLILLDLNLPRMSGREVLADIKNLPELRTIPVVVLTSSDAESDIVQSYDLGASCYITKPVDLESFLKIVSKLEEFWFTVVKLPPKSVE